MNDIVIARALHVLAVVHWIGGMFMVTAVTLPSVARLAEPERRIALFESIEGAFSWQAKISVTLAGVTGFYITHRLDGWSRFLDPSFWWMHAMLAVWALFTFVLFVAEPLFLHDWFRRAAAKDAAATFALTQRFHWALLTVSLVVIGAAMLGAHGVLY